MSCQSIKIFHHWISKNLNNSLRFYKTIGFKIEYERPENKFVFLSLGEIQFMLQEISEDDKWDVAPLSYPFGNGINFQLEVDNVDRIYKSLKDNNYKIAFEKTVSLTDIRQTTGLRTKQDIYNAYFGDA